MFTGFGFRNHPYPLTLTDDGERILRARMTTSAADFYDALAPWYHLIYEDWQASIERQGAALESVMRSAVSGECRTVLDVACGIGTQSLGLALKGFEVTGSDVSAAAVERARREASQRGLSIGLSVADMRRAHAHHAREFDVVLCADNSLPHLLSDEDISVALREFFLCTRPGGVTILSVRDYSQVERVSSMCGASTMLTSSRSSSEAGRKPEGNLVIDLDSYLLFVAAAVVLVLVPGPDMAYMLGRTVAQGRKAGVLAALGINAGAYVHVVAVVLGLSAILAASAFAFTAIKWAGACYLIWIGLRAVFRKRRDCQVEKQQPDHAVAQQSHGRDVHRTGSAPGK